MLQVGEDTQKVRTVRPVQQRRELHKYVLICVGLLFSTITTFPIAYFRVSNSGRYNAGPFNSWSLEETTPVLKGEV